MASIWHGGSENIESISMAYLAMAVAVRENDVTWRPTYRRRQRVTTAAAAMPCDDAACRHSVAYQALAPQQQKTLCSMAKRQRINARKKHKRIAKATWQACGMAPKKTKIMARNISEKACSALSGRTKQ